jgi:hypothetical protein
MDASKVTVEFPSMPKEQMNNTKEYRDYLEDMGQLVSTRKGQDGDSEQRPSIVELIEAYGLHCCHTQWRKATGTISVKGRLIEGSKTRGVFDWVNIRHACEQHVASELKAIIRATKRLKSNNVDDVKDKSRAAAIAFPNAPIVASGKLLKILLAFVAVVPWLVSFPMSGWTENRLRRQVQDSLQEARDEKARASSAWYKRVGFGQCANFVLKALEKRTYKGWRYIWPRKKSRNLIWKFIALICSLLYISFSLTYTLVAAVMSTFVWRPLLALHRLHADEVRVNLLVKSLRNQASGAVRDEDGEHTKESKKEKMRKQQILSTEHFMAWLSSRGFGMFVRPFEDQDSVDASETLIQCISSFAVRSKGGLPIWSSRYRVDPSKPMWERDDMGTSARQAKHDSRLDAAIMANSTLGIDDFEAEDEAPKKDDRNNWLYESTNPMTLRDDMVSIATFDKPAQVSRSSLWQTHADEHAWNIHYIEVDERVSNASDGSILTIISQEEPDDEDDDAEEDGEADSGADLRTAYRVNPGS